MKKVFLSIMVLLIAMTMASCESKPDASMLPDPEIEFRVIKGIEGTSFKIEVINLDDVPRGTTYTTSVSYIISNADGDVLFSLDAPTMMEAMEVVYGTVDDVSVGDKLTCTVSFSYEGNTTSATASDIVV